LQFHIYEFNEQLKVSLLTHKGFQMNDELSDFLGQHPEITAQVEAL
jgi:hypothetical protein